MSAVPLGQNAVMSERHPALWSGRWPAEDGGPSRLQSPVGGEGLGLAGRPDGGRLVATSRTSMVNTMVVLRNPGEVYLLCHTGGDDAVSWVEQLHPVTLETLRRSPDLPGGPTWPGGLAAHADGSLYVVFGCHAHRLSADLAVLASTTLPRRRAYNSFVVLPDGHLVMKDFPRNDRMCSELVVLRPGDLAVVATCELPEPSIARLSADGDDVYAVGDEHLFRVRWDGGRLELDPSLVARYRTIEGQTFGWDAVITGGAAWFLDNGAGSDRYAGSFRGLGVSTAPLHLVRVDLASGAVQLAEVCGLSGGLIANPPAVDIRRGVAVGYDSGNGVVTAFRINDEGIGERLWSVPLNHAAHPLLFPDTGELVLCHHEPGEGESVVVLEVETGRELGRVATGGPVQSVVFGSAGFGHDLYLCSFTTVTRVSVE